MVHSAVERTFSERFRIAALTLWVPIVILALLPVVIFVGLDVAHALFSFFAFVAGKIASNSEASDALTLFGGLIVGGWVVYTLLASPSGSRFEKLGHGATLSAAILGALGNSLTGSHAMLTAAPWLLIVVVEAYHRIRRERDAGEREKRERSRQR
jgi:hypothetical protein